MTFEERDWTSAVGLLEGRRWEVVGELLLLFFVDEMLLLLFMFLGSKLNLFARIVALSASFDSEFVLFVKLILEIAVDGVDGDADGDADVDVDGDADDVA